MIEGIIFDMDGLLFSSEQVVQRSWNIVGESLGLGKIGEHIYHTLGMNVKSRMEYFYKAYGPDFPSEAFTVETRKTFQQIADEEGIPLKPGVKEFLEYVKERDYKLAVATSSRREHSSRLLKSGGIYGYFDGFVYGDMVINAKPDPEIYTSACSLIGADPGNCIALEDAPNGIRSAYAAGLHPIMIPDLVQPTQEICTLAYKVFDNIYEATGALEELEKQEAGK